MEQKYTLVFTGQQLDVIFQGLQDLPFKVAAPVVGDIQRQLQEAQIKQSEPAPEK